MRASERRTAPPPPPEVKLGTDSGPEPKRAREPVRTEQRAPRGRPVASRPPIRSWLIPFPEKRRRETRAYTQRHYGTPSADLRPTTIVEHFSVTPSVQGVYDLFARDEPDAELKELPGLCAHFVVDRDGTIFQLVPVAIVCRHTVGLNDSAIGIEHVGASDAAVMGSAPQLRASLRLTAWLRCRYGIDTRDVIGHAESLSSRFHHEQVAALRSQTHDDFARPAMTRYRRLLARRACA